MKKTPQKIFRDWADSKQFDHLKHIPENNFLVWKKLNVHSKTQPSRNDASIIY